MNYQEKRKTCVYYTQTDTYDECFKKTLNEKFGRKFNCSLPILPSFLPRCNIEKAIESEQVELLRGKKAFNARPKRFNLLQTELLYLESQKAMTRLRMNC